MNSWLTYLCLEHSIQYFSAAFPMVQSERRTRGYNLRSSETGTSFTNQSLHPLPLFELSKKSKEPRGSIAPSIHTNTSREIRVPCRSPIGVHVKVRGLKVATYQQNEAVWGSILSRYCRRTRVTRVNSLCIPAIGGPDNRLVFLEVNGVLVLRASIGLLQC